MQKFIEMVEKHRDLIYDAEKFLWEHPETGFCEWESSEYLASRYEDLGYTLTKAGNIPGFYTDIDTGCPGPKVLIMAELDALKVPDHPAANPVTGAAHACGHHCQGAALLGVAAALKEEGALDGLCGSIRLCAVPAEEALSTSFGKELRDKGIIKRFTGKAEFLYRGYFDDMDMAIIVHTSGGKHSFHFTDKLIGANHKLAVFEGKAAAAAGPWAGINALNAANAAINGIHALRETFRSIDEIRVHPIIDLCGSAVNVIPMKAVMENQIRGASTEAIMDANRKVNRAVACAAASMGAKVHLFDEPGYWPTVYDKNLAELAQKAFSFVVGKENITVNYGRVDGGYGCTDAGDISSVMPIIQPYCGGSAGPAHNKEYRIEDVDSACMDPAKGQFLLVQMLLCDDAKEAKNIIAEKNVQFKSVKEYIEAAEKMQLDIDAVEYESDNMIHIRYQ